MNKGWGYIHIEGPQANRHRCAVPDYGYDAETVDEPCSFACRGYQQEEVFFYEEKAREA